MTFPFSDHGLRGFTRIMVIEQIGFDTKMKQLQADIRDLLQQEEESKQELKALFEMLEYTL